MKRIMVLLYLSFLSTLLCSQTETGIIKITRELKLLKISDNAYIHISYMKNKKDKIPCNGLILVGQGKAFLFDTPSTDSITQILLSYIKNDMHLQIAGCITNDWHWDSMGGMNEINKAGIPSYANEMTRTIAEKKGLPLPQFGFKDSLFLKLGEKDIRCYYLGPAHTLDNIVVWIPSEKILFADCMVKELKSKDLGYTEDGDVSAYPVTLKKVKDKFPDAKFVIPGHGNYGGTDLIEHTLQLTKQN